MATETIKLIVGLGELLIGTLVYFDALGTTFHRLSFDRNSDCPVCGSDPSVTELIDYKAFCGEEVT